MTGKTEQDKMNNKEAELEYLMRRFGNKVLQLAYSYLRDREEAEDAAQEVFLRVFTSLDKFQGKSSPFTWIYSITVNLCRDSLRKQSLIHWEELPEEQPLPSGRDTEEEVMADLEEKAVFQAVMELPVNYREVIVLYYLNQLSIKEIAAITSATQSVVKVRLHRGRQRLKKLLLDRGVVYGE